MKILRLLGIILVVVSICHKLHAAEDSRFVDFEEASRLYSDSLFEKAAERYESILKSGDKSANLYYNLGNAYFKLGSLGKAILNYERAKRLMPYDASLRSNLEYAYSLVEEPPMEKSRIWLRRRVRNFLDSFTIDGLTKLLSLIYLIALGLLALLIFKSQLRRLLMNSIFALIVVFMFTLTLLCINVYRTETLQSAVIITREANARFEPIEGGTVHYKLYEGLMVEVLKTRGQWSQIRREDGKIGWLQASSYEII
ncbi:MAG: hypothetical protein HQ572_01350 [Candidatus Omnitrophica bacterium]|nr:hypothetical protein [Candidatus Omnitrophota bacterium]